MKDIITSIFGSYTPIMSTRAIPVVSAEGVTTYDLVEVVAEGMAGIDWTWIAGVALFAIVLYSFFRCVGALLK